MYDVTKAAVQEAISARLSGLFSRSVAAGGWMHAHQAAGDRLARPGVA
jgi:hypothetical protein